MSPLIIILCVMPSAALHIRTGYNNTRTSGQHKLADNLDVCGLTCADLIGDKVTMKTNSLNVTIPIPGLKPSLCNATKWGPFAEDIIDLKLCKSENLPNISDDSTFAEICKETCKSVMEQEAKLFAYLGGETNDEQGNNEEEDIELLHGHSARSLFSNRAIESTDDARGKPNAITTVKVKTTTWGYENSWMIQKIPDENKNDGIVLGDRQAIVNWNWRKSGSPPEMPLSPDRLCYRGIDNTRSPWRFWGRSCCWYGDGTQYGSGYQTSAEYQHVCQKPLTPGWYQVTCGCAYGDGWHGGFIEINGKQLCKSWWQSSKTEVFYIADDSPHLTYVPGLGGDPHATNLAGQKFEILQVGTFPLVEITAARFASVSPYLAVSAGINHVEGDCGPTYIQNVSLSGKWLFELAGTSGVQVRVVHWVPKEEALQVRINDQEHEWRPVSRAKEALKIVSKATDSQVNFKVHQVTVHVSLGLNERKVDKAKGYNFLNVNFRGLDTTNKDMKLSGLIISDDVAALSQAPTKCQAAGFSKGAGQADTTFLSYITLGKPIDAEDEELGLLD